jgi:hypothetical protein
VRSLGPLLDGVIEQPLENPEKNTSWVPARRPSSLTGSGHGGILGPSGGGLPSLGNLGSDSVDLTGMIQNGLPPIPKAFDESGYTQGRKLGNGAFGDVHQLDPNEEGRGKVALKTARSEAGQEDLKNEANILEKLGNHENIVGYEGVGSREDGTSTLALELLGGGDLQQMQDQLESAYKARKISHEQYWGTNQYLLRGVTSGVGHMNEKGLTHGDLKMGNVGLNSETLTPKVLDFGTTREVGEQGHQAMTPSVNLAPERFSDNPTMHETNDVYAIGQISHSMGRGGFHEVGNGGAYGPMIARSQQYKRAMAGEDVDPFTGPGAYDQFLSGTLAPLPEDRMTANEALQSDFLSDGLLEDEGAKGVLAQMLDDRGTGVNYGEQKSELELVRESNEGRDERLAQARVQNKQDKLSGKKALKQAKEGLSGKDVKNKSAMLKELKKRTKGTRKGLDKDAERRRKAMR